MVLPLKPRINLARAGQPEQAPGQRAGAGGLPRASFLLPVRDGARTLGRAVACLLAQSEPRHEVIVSDDGSTDETPAVAAALASADARVRLVSGPPGGIAAALNRALPLARAPVVVRMDADDTCPPERLALLLETLAARPEVGVVGSAVTMVPPERVGVGMRRYLAWQNALADHDAMARERFVESPITHATCAFRRPVLEAAGGWRDGVAEDVDLWLRLFAAGVRFAKRPEVLYLWHEHEARATRHDPIYATEAMRACKARHLARAFAGRPLAVFGTGRSQGAWEGALADAGATLAAGGCLDPRALRRGAALPWAPPAEREAALVLPFLAASVRAELRRRLAAAGERELESFAFVA